MNTKNNGVEDAPKVAESSQKLLTIQDVKKMVDRDLQVVTAFLQAIQDPDVANAVSTFLHGKYMNARHREELDKQVVLDIEAGAKARKG